MRGDFVLRLMRATAPIVLLLASSGCEGTWEAERPPPPPPPAPAKLAFRSAPLAEQARVSFTPVVVEVRTDGDVLVSDDEGRAIALVVAGGGTGTLSGSITVRTIGGLAVFDDLAYDRPGTLSLRAEATGLATAETPSFEVSAGPSGGAAIALASVSSTEGQGNGASGPSPMDGSGGPPALSGDGRYTFFSSLASNLSPGDTNAVRDVFVRDVVLGETTRVNLEDGGGQFARDCVAPSTSANGRIVGFVCGSAAHVRDRLTGETASIVGGAYSLSVGASGRHVVHDSAGHVFALDRLSGVTRQMDLSTEGVAANESTFEQAPAVTGDGRFVVFTSRASNLVADDTNGTRDVFLRDRDADHDGTLDEAGEVVTERVSVAPGGGQFTDAIVGGNAVSSDGRFIAFDAGGRIFVRDRLLGTTTLADHDTAGGQPDGWAWGAAISADGRFVAFASYANDLVAPPLSGYVTQVFVWSRTTGAIALVSESAGGLAGDADATPYAGPTISADGRYIAFYSAATNLVAVDANGVLDAFVAPNPLLP